MSEDTDFPDEIINGFAPVPHEVCRSKVGHPAFHVYVALHRWAWNGQGGTCWATVEKIGEQAGGMGERAVQRALARLVKFGFITNTPDPSKKTGRVLTVASGQELVQRCNAFGGVRNDGGRASEMTPKEDESKNKQNGVNEEYPPLSPLITGLDRNLEPPAEYAQKIMASPHRPQGQPEYTSEQAMFLARRRWAVQGLNLLYDGRTTEADDPVIAGRVASALNDRRSFRYYLKIIRDLRTGKYKFRDVESAFDRATDASIANPAGYFATAIKGLSNPESLRPDDSTQFSQRFIESLKTLTAKGASLREVEHFSSLLSEGLRDPSHRGDYVKVGEAVRSGELPIENVREAYKNTLAQSISSHVRSPGGYFRKILAGHNIDWEKPTKKPPEKKTSKVIPST